MYHPIFCERRSSDDGLNTRSNSGIARNFDVEELRIHVHLFKRLSTSHSRHDSFSLEDSRHSIVHTRRL